MKNADINPGSVYDAYCGSLAQVRVIRTGVEQTQTTGRVRRTGVEVEALKDIPWAINQQILSHRQGERFVVESKHFVREVQP